MTKPLKFIAPQDFYNVARNHLGATAGRGEAAVREEVKVLIFDRSKAFKAADEQRDGLHQHLGPMIR